MLYSIFASNQLNNLKILKNLLESSDFRELLEEAELLTQLIRDGIGVPAKEEEIRQALSQIPKGNIGVSFTHFLHEMASIGKQNNANS
jgi:hypothetical protein